MNGNMITWGKHLETGHVTVDNDHKQLIAQLNQLSDALTRGEGKDQVLKMLAFLHSYAREHFAREESHMQKVKCPAISENCRAHADFIAKLETWVAKLKTSGNTTVLVLEIHRDASDWIRSHILNVDCSLRRCRAA